MRIALAQINTTAGDLDGNAGKITIFARQAAERGADLVVFPELSVTGYPPLDLLTYDAFVDDVEAATARIAAECPPEIGVVVGAPIRNPREAGRRLHNAALLFGDGRLQGTARKALLPTYDVYDEHRYFEPDRHLSCLTWRGAKLAVHLCEDMWNVEPEGGFRRYPRDPLEDLGDAEVFINLSATPYSRHIDERRTAAIEAACRRYARPLVMVNQVGANGELVFDGDSRVHGADGGRLVTAPRFEEALVIWDSGSEVAEPAEVRPELQNVHDALVLGIRDYLTKAGGLSGVLVGLSGGIDSAVSCALAVRAVGPERVTGLSLPSEFTSRASVDDARELAGRLGIAFQVHSIQPALDAFRATLGAGPSEGIVDENLQARIRMALLMAHANRRDALVLCPGNKSELAVGYSTLYGDLAGGLCVLGDVLKSDVYGLAHYINEAAGQPILSERILTRAPSAELRPGQTDADDLPPYDVLDHVLRLYIEDRLDVAAIADCTGASDVLVAGIVARVDRSEFKRRQAPPVLRVTRKAFGPDRRMPLIQAWRRRGEER